MADIQGAPDNDIRRAGRWNQEAMESCYLTSLPRQAMRVLAGFPTERGSFYIERALVDPPQSLQEKVFPEIDQWLHLIGAEADNGVEKTIAAHGFLSTLKQMRAILLQDAVFLIEEFPSLAVWDHEIFQMDDFKTFAAELKQAIITTPEPADIIIQQAIPAVATSIDNLGLTIQNHHRTILQQMEEMKNMSERVQSTYDDLTNGRIPLYMSTTNPESVGQVSNI